MSVAFVLGNGQSRSVIDLTRIKPLGPIYGCNGLYRDFEPDCLVATDRPIAEHIQRSGYSKKIDFTLADPCQIWAHTRFQKSIMATVQVLLHVL